MRKQPDEEPVISEDDDQNTCDGCGAAEAPGVKITVKGDSHVCQKCAGELDEIHLGAARPKHILKGVHRSKDPDARAEAVSYCGEWEECSGSGKHGMSYGPASATCPACIDIYKTQSTNDPEDY
jgi:hypothetical protein